MGTRIVIGPPGTGKTTYLKRQVEAACEKYDPEQIYVCSFSRAAVRELVSRDLPIPKENCGTIHALGYHALDMPELVENRKGFAEFAEMFPGFAAVMARSSPPVVDDANDEVPEILQAVNDRRARLVPEKLWPQHLRHFWEAWKRYKQEVGGIDFGDMIEQPYHQQVDLPTAPRVLVVDEAQDLTPAEHRLVAWWGRNADHLILVGDPDQAIYTFKGADPGLLSTKGREHRVLSQSWRVPREVRTMAAQIAARIIGREVHDYRPTDVDGYVRRVSLPLAAAVDLLPESGTVMFLASCSYMLQGLIAALKDKGVPFHNPYRRRAAAWNPLWQPEKKGRVSFITRLNAYLNLEWTVNDIKLWSHLVKGMFSRKDLLILDDLPGNAVLSSEQLQQVLPEKAYIGAAWRELEWLRENLRAEYVSRWDYYYKVLNARPTGWHEAPRVIVGTIHSVKGGEADHVVLAPDISWRAMKGGDWSAIYRMFYVGATRAREGVIVTAPFSKWFAAI